MNNKLRNNTNSRVPEAVDCCVLFSHVIDKGEESGHELWNVQDCPDCCVLLPWLNLLFLSPELARSRDQLRWVGIAAIPRHIYDKLCQEGLLASLQEKLWEIYPDSFLLRLAPEQILHRKCPLHPLNLEMLEGWLPRILSFGSSRLVEGERNLFQAVHKAWRQIQEQTQSKTNHESVYGYQEYPSVWNRPSFWRLFWENVKDHSSADSKDSAQPKNENE